MRLTALVLASWWLLVPAVPIPARAAGGDKKADLAAVAKTLSAYMKKKTLGKRDPEDIAKRMEGIVDEDLSWVLDRLREVPGKDRAEAGAEVEGLVENRLLTIRYTSGVLKLKDAWKRFADAAEPSRLALLADLSRLEDPEPATRFGLWALEGASLPVRLRALETLADLCSWGGDETRLLPALRKGLDDPSPAVRDLALERLSNLCDTAALDWCFAHMGEAAEETVEVGGKTERRCPGDRAMDIVERPSKLHFGMEGEDFRGLATEDKNAILAEFRAWRAGAGRNPLRDGTEGPFDPLPKITSAVVDPIKDPTAAMRWWSEVDRAQFRLDLDEMSVVATSKIDWVCQFHMTVGASGARQGDWEADARKVRCGARFRLPRKGFGLVEVAVQNLLDGRWKVWVRAYEWKAVR